MSPRCCATFLALALTLASSVAAQFVPAPTDLISATGYANVTVRYKEVPAGICELDPDVKSFAGYADVSENEHIFFYFFEARNQDPTTAPLTVWINGGPGSSSMIGLFSENGPCGIDPDGNVYNNPYSWSNVSNMIYIDQPTMVGFSYSIPVPAYVDPSSGYIVTLPDETCPDYAADWGCGTYSYPNASLTANSTPAAAPNFWLTLQGFMGVFPQYSAHEFAFGTESYGGHYAPIFNEYFEKQNAKNIPGAHQISLGAVMVGNGWYDPLIQYEAYWNFTVYPGNTYDYFPFNDSEVSQMYNSLYGPGNCVDQIKDCNTRGIDEICSAADNFCYAEVEYLYDLYLNRDEYDFRELMPDPFPPTTYIDYLNTPTVQAALGAYQNYSDASDFVSNTFGTTGDDGRILTSVSDVKLLLDQNVTFMMYVGDADYICNWIGGEVVSDEVGAPGWGEAGYTNLTTSDGIVHGQVKQSAKFSFVRIYESGHLVPFYQPLAALEIIDRALNGVDIATGSVEVGAGYITSGTPKSTYHEGNSTIQFEVVDPDATYNTTTNEPNPPVNSTSSRKRDAARLGKRWRWT